MIKKFTTTIIAALCAVCCIASCASNATEHKVESNKKSTNMKSDSKKLVVFFSRTGENYDVGHITKGNTHIVADMIADAVGADRFEIVPSKPYPDGYNECVEVARDEKQRNARPAVNGDIAIEDYDMIFIGYPNWWGEAPMCVYTFIERHNWNGKTVVPFITHEGSGFSGSDLRIAAACKGATAAKCLAIQGKTAQNNRTATEKSVKNWIKQLGL